MPRVFSARAEVFRARPGRSESRYCLLRTRGGVPRASMLIPAPARSSPHARRCSRQDRPLAPQRHVFSARAEVFRCSTSRTHSSRRLLRTRGGVPGSSLSALSSSLSSPHARRCSQLVPSPRVVGVVFSARAEVFPSWASSGRPGTGLLRTRGGVPMSSDSHPYETRSSPHARRCSPMCRRSASTSTVFSARAKVFRLRERRRVPAKRPLRTRGGIRNVEAARIGVCNFAAAQRPNFDAMNPAFASLTARPAAKSGATSCMCRGRDVLGCATSSTATLRQRRLI